ncbi:hypothetical protein [Candidatus Vidania fulgoroideorum]
MERIIESKLKEIYILKKKTIKKRLKYISFIKENKNKGLRKIKRLMKYKMTIVERKLNSPLYGLLKNQTIRKFKKEIKINTSILSILIDRKHFGSGYYEIVKTNRYIKRSLRLKKEFIIDIVQLYLCIYEYEIVLVIQHLNSKEKTKNIINITKVLNIIVIEEVKNVKELIKARKDKRNSILGINSRNLKNFKIRKKKILELVNKTNIIFESGIENKNEIIKIRNIGFKSTIVGSGLSKESFFIKNKKS